MRHLTSTLLRGTFRAQPHIWTIARCTFQGRFSESAPDSEAPQAAAQPPKKASLKIIVKHRGVDTDPDNPAMNITSYASITEFNDPKKSRFPIPDSLPKALQEAGYVTPTPIQQHTIPMLLLGEDLIGLAPTGTGKTLAFAVPALTAIQPNVRSCQVLVLCPTRELAMQTFNVFDKIAAPMGVKCASAYGGPSNRNLQSSLVRGAQVIIATPGRLTDFARAGIIDLSHCQFFVLDEADRLLDMGFKPQIDDIMYFFRTNNLVPQTMMWSATWDEKIQGLAAEYIKENYFMVSTGAHETGHSVNPLIKQTCYFSDRGNPSKVQTLMKLYQNGVIKTEEKIIIFVERKDTAADVFAVLRQNFRSAYPSLSNLFCLAVHGNLHQSDRERAIGTFKDGPCHVLVATDVVARGIDIPNVSHVINYEMPSTFDSYVHRIGRTGRNGQVGNSHAFFDSATDIALAPSLSKFLKGSDQHVPPKLLEFVDRGNDILQRRKDRKEERYGGGQRKSSGGGGRRSGNGGGGYYREDEYGY